MPRGRSWLQSGPLPRILHVQVLVVELVLFRLELGFPPVPSALRPGAHFTYFSFVVTVAPVSIVTSTEAAAVLVVVGVENVPG